MNEMLERGVHAMMQAMEQSGRDTGDMKLKDFYAMGRAFLAAVRTPIDAVLAASEDACADICESTGNPKERTRVTYQAVIDAILAD